MTDKCQGKSIPWSDMESYLTLHQMSMEPFVAMSKSGLIKTEMIESSMPPQFLKMYELIT
jgi:hypothetical protein